MDVRVCGCVGVWVYAATGMSALEPHAPRICHGVSARGAEQSACGVPGAGAGDREALFLSYWDLPTSQEQELTVIRPLHENGVTGMEFAKPLGQDAATLRVSMQAELVGEHVQLGKSAHESHLFIDGVVDKECPLLFDGGGDDANFTRLCLETPTQQRALTFPDASGTVITSGNREDIAALRGLAGEDTLVFTGRFRDLGSVVPPRPPRLTCGAMACENRTTEGIAGSEGTGCLELDYAGREFDVFRLYYAFEDLGANALIRAPSAVLEQLVRANATGASRMELALLYLQLQEQVSGQRGVGAEAWAALRERGSFGAVTDLEECFVCCCGLLPNATQGPAPSSLPPRAPRALARSPACALSPLARTLGSCSFALSLSLSSFLFFSSSPRSSSALSPPSSSSSRWLSF
eukprot:2847532-Rhodomonas_salina.2